MAWMCFCLQMLSTANVCLTASCVAVQLLFILRASYCAVIDVYNLQSQSKVRTQPWVHKRTNLHNKSCFMSSEQKQV